ncbi:unnamed protein product, partial [Discosporangium mesarthrocarpum]
MKDDIAARLRSVLSAAGIPQEGFPVKVSVPLLLSVKAVVTFEGFSAEPISAKEFAVPGEYKRSKRMSKELYMAGVWKGGAGAGPGGLMHSMATGATGFDDSEEDSEAEGAVEELDQDPVFSDDFSGDEGSDAADSCNSRQASSVGTGNGSSSQGLSRAGNESQSRGGGAQGPSSAHHGHGLPPSKSHHNLGNGSAHPGSNLQGIEDMGGRRTGGRASLFPVAGKGQGDGGGGRTRPGSAPIPIPPPQNAVSDRKRGSVGGRSYDNTR